jgi:hypothetical protein
MSVWLDLQIILKTIPALVEQTRETRQAPGEERRETPIQTTGIPPANGVVKRI